MSIEGQVRAMYRRYMPVRIRMFIRGSRFDGVVGRIHLNDDMLHVRSAEGVEQYIDSGLSALGNIEETLRIANTSFDQIDAYLDIPCGYGRVLRWVQTKIPPSRITACDLNREAVDFCRSEFRVKPLYSKKNLKHMMFPEKYDLIWVGSLLTHLDADGCLETLEALAHALSPKGILMFSTHGETCIEVPGLPAYCARFRDIEEELKKDFVTDGFCYAPYEEGGDYGISVTSKDYISALMERNLSSLVKLIRFKQRGWQDHHDVWSYQRV